ncbi:AsnC family transcriptional regulator [Candidatus Woesearchaeota archaeon]|nr:AsnC family transcriptional regulator [Candidatus Woesearchaeota archaeon]
MDKKDYQIMELLGRNCRIPHSTIGSALKLSKDAVLYRIRKLEISEMIKQYVLFIDARRLGFTRYHILVSFDADLKKYGDLYLELAKHPFVMWINSFIGRYDAQIIVDAWDGFHLNRIKEDLFSVCKNKIKGYVVLTHLYDLEFTQLNPSIYEDVDFQKKMDHSFSALINNRNFPVSPHFERQHVSETEVELLKELSDDPRKSLINLGKNIGVDRITAKKRIAALIKDKIILSFAISPNLEKLGFVTYYLLVRLKQDIPYNVLKRPFERLQNIFYAGKMLGDYDLILYLNARNPQELNSSIELFKKDIEEYIIHYDLLVQDKVHFWKQFTAGLYSALKK